MYTGVPQVVHQYSREHNEQREQLDKVVTFLRAKRCPAILLDKIRYFVYYTFTAVKQEHERAAILKELPRSPSLPPSLTCALFRAFTAT